MTETRPTWRGAYAFAVLVLALAMIASPGRAEELAKRSATADDIPGATDSEGELTERERWEERLAKIDAEIKSVEQDRIDTRAAVVQRAGDLRKRKDDLAMADDELAELRERILGLRKQLEFLEKDYKSRIANEPEIKQRTAEQRQAVLDVREWDKKWRELHVQKRNAWEKLQAAIAKEKKEKSREADADAP